MENYFVLQCDTTILYYTIFVMLTIVYKLVLHAVGLVLAFLTRNIKVDVLNDYRYNSAIIIASSALLLTVCFNTQSVTRGYRNRSEIVWAILVFLNISVYLGLTFIPKVGLWVGLMW